MITIGNGESPPWADLPLACPTCGAGPLPLHASTDVAGGPGALHYIKHCGSAWVRGPYRTEGAPE